MLHLLLSFFLILFHFFFFLSYLVLKKKRKFDFKKWSRKFHFTLARKISTKVAANLSEKKKKNSALKNNPKNNNTLFFASVSSKTHGVYLMNTFVEGIRVLKHMNEWLDFTLKIRNNFLLCAKTKKLEWAFQNLMVEMSLNDRKVWIYLAIWNLSLQSWF